jgi:hypothetical protein
MFLRRLLNGTTFLTGCLSAWLLFGGYIYTPVEAACPSTFHNGWPKNAGGTFGNPGTITFAFSVNKFDISPNTAETTWLLSGLARWDVHNFSNNCSKVDFTQTSAGFGPQLTITTNNGQDSVDASAVALTTIDNYNGSVVNEATITFYWGAKYNNNTTLSWNRNASTAYYNFIKKVILHEVGHTMGLNEFSGTLVAGQTVMNGYVMANDSTNRVPLEIQNCDNNSVNSIPQYFGNCQFNTAQTQECIDLGYSTGYATNYDHFPETGCAHPGWDYGGGCCIDGTTPIIIDVLGNGYNLTGTNNPVSFNFFGTSTPFLFSWTAAGSDDAFLVLDKNNNGTIDNGAELFGNVTPQPQSSERNGFLALAEYDKPASGGNNNGKINQADAIFSSLRLWQDVNHNGISESSELHTLPSLHVLAIDLDYKESKREDQHGNKFKYRAKVRDEQGASVGRWAWDVFIQKQ